MSSDGPKPILIPMPVLPSSASTSSSSSASSAPTKRRTTKKRAAKKKAVKKRVVRKAASGGLEAQVREIAASKGKISAIKFYRERTGTGLADAKAAVEAIIG